MMNSLQGASTKSQGGSTESQGDSTEKSQGLGQISQGLGQIRGGSLRYQFISPTGVSAPRQPPRSP